MMKTAEKKILDTSSDGSRITIRLAQPRDVEMLIPLIRAYYRFDHIRFNPRTIRPTLERLLRSRSLGRAWLIRDGVRAVGYVILTYCLDLEFGGIEGLVTDLFIQEAHRGRGLGRRALDAVDDHCRAHRIGTVELQVEENNIAAQEFYRRVGFKRLSRIVMTRDVRQR